MRGIFASGVLDAFVESRYYPFDLIIGVSAGATNLVSYLSEQPRRSHHIITELACSSDFLDPLRFVKGGDLVDIGWLWQVSRHRFPLDLDTFCARDIPFYAVRHSVKPGVTGWAQVSYQYGASREDTVEKLQYDLYYVKNHSLFLDLVILFQTVGVVLTGKGAQ